MAFPNRTLAEWLDYIGTQHHKDIALGLERSSAVAARLAVLPLAPRQLIVAGTNGKGSTVRAAESLLLAQGYTVGATLSPHLERYNERVRINGREATDEQLVQAFCNVEAARGEIPLTYYEYSVLGAFWLFHQAKLDVCLLEVGLGGRLDATNIVDAEVAAVTSIGLDHQQFLGDTLELIGAEKAAVCRSGRPLLLGGAMPDSVTQVAAKTGALVERFGEHFWYQRGAGASSLRLDRGAINIESLTEPQVAWRNLALAAACVQKLTRTPSSQELEQACKTIRHPGRFEQFSFRGRQLVLDVAHNPAGAAFLAKQLRASWPDSKFVACCGFLADKDVEGIVAELSGEVAHWVFVSTEGSRGLSGRDAQRLARPILDAMGAAPSARQQHWSVEQNLVDALDKAHAVAGKADIIVVFGSFMQVQQVRDLLHSNI